MLVRGFARTISDGNPVPDGTEVRIRLHEDNSLIATTTTLGGEYEHNFQGNPGPYWVEVEHAGETHVSSSKVIGMSGPVSIGGIPLLFRLWEDGYIPGVLDELAVTSSGVGMSVTVDGGAAIVRGVLYDQADPLSVALDAADSQQRIDLVVLQVVPAGANDNTEGRARIVAKKGTPSDSPAAPGVTETSSLWEIPLARVTVDIGASSIASNKVEDVRPRADVKIFDGQIVTDMLADASVTTGKIADSAVTTDKIASNAVTRVKVVDGAINGPKIQSNSISNVHIINGTIVNSNIMDETIAIGKLVPGTLDTRYYTENEIDTMLALRKPRSDQGTFSADQTVSTAGTRQPTLSGDPVGTLGFSGLLPGALYSVRVSVAYRITGAPAVGASIGYQVVGASTNNALTPSIPLTDNANYVSWTWGNVHTASAGGAITVRPVTQWGVGSYTITWVSIAASLDIVL